VKGAGTLAISAKGDKAIAYLCDGKRLEAWFTGTAKAGKLSLTGAHGAKLTGTFGNGRASGTVTAAGRSLAFNLATVKKPSGLYRATANVRGAKIVGGWIRLPNGQQVGLATVDGTVVTPSELDIATGTATVSGVTVTATPASGELR
jgi:serine/threonine-protein kinase